MHPDPNADADALEAEFEAFSQLCERLQGFGSETLPEFADGYMTALLCGPVTVQPMRFAEAVFGDAFGRAFADPQDLQQGMDTLAARWNRIAHQLLPERLLDDEDALHLTPLMQLWDDEAREELRQELKLDEAQMASVQTGALWAEGFLQAVEDHADDWSEPASARKADAEGVLDELLSAVEVLLAEPGSDTYQAYVRAGWPDADPTRDELINEASYAVQEMRLYWVHYPPRREPVRNEIRPGRNDLCFCGSGKKYKKCHGAAPND
jgi:uncharacterized protein